MTTIAPDLRLLLHDTGTPDCTSRSQHACTKVATHACRSTKPCPDPTPFIYWCESRYQVHMRRLGDCICSHCRRLTIDCWMVWPL